MLLLLERITKLNLESQNSHLRLLARMDIATKLDILEQQRHIFHKLKQQHLDVDKTVLTLSSLILAIDLKVNSTDAVTLNAIKLRAAKQKRNTSRKLIEKSDAKKLKPKQRLQHSYPSLPS